MSEYRRQTGVAVAIALVGALSLAILASYSFPAQPVAVSTVPQTTSVASVPSTASTTSISPGPTATTSTQSQSVSTGDATTTVITLPPTSTQGQNGTSIPTVSNGVNVTEAALTALGSPAVQGYVGEAYSYSVEQARQSSDNPSLIYVTFNVTESRSVAGNWTTGYSVTFSGNTILNASVLFTAPSTYQMTNLAVTNLPAYGQSISFTAEQQQVIQVALSNSAVKQYTTQSEYYVLSVTYFPTDSGNKTFAGDYLVYIGQVNGSANDSCVIGIFVNPNTNSVVTTYNDTRMACT